MGAGAFVRAETEPLVDFLIRYFETQNRMWRDLYIGERLKQLHLPTDDVEQNLARRKQILTGDREGLGKLVSGELDPGSREQLDMLLGDALRLAIASTEEVHALFVGDCLLLHISSFCTTALLEQGITLRPIFETSKNPYDLRNSIQKLEGTAFDLVCYSPYTYEFSLLLYPIFHLRSLTYSRRKLRDLAQSGIDQTTLTLELLADRFECPVAVHKTANIRPYQDNWRSYATTVATRSVRKTVANMLNDVLEKEIAKYNKTASRPLIVIDERPIHLKYGERELGQKLYDTLYYHPTLLSLRLARLYSNLLTGAKYLLQKKVVVTDLDNTLWTGLIGEGPVEHQHVRQEVLKTLRQKGIVLAICSKNDPKSIRWDGALLGEADFVASQINWENKPLNLKRIAARLNLDLSDFVFIDDRDDEIAMVNLALPQVHTLAANSDQTWEMLEWWAAALPDQGNTDRTRLYRERDARESYLTTEAVVDQDRLLCSLNLKLDIREASTRDLARLVELINRTHQFNTNQQHVTPQRVSAWIDSSQYRIVVGEATDRFGAMGLISAMIVEVGALELQIHLWVLSCRVFGYGIETAMLNHLKRFAQALNRNRIRGHLVATSQNGPCQEVYHKYGFSWDDSTWAFEGASIIPDPPWLSINGQEPSGRLDTDRQVA